MMMTLFVVMVIADSVIIFVIAVCIHIKRTPIIPVVGLTYLYSPVRAPGL